MISKMQGAHTKHSTPHSRKRADEKAQYSSRDSLACKVSAVAHGYFEDQYIARVGLQLRSKYGLQDTRKRSPLIHRGYLARHDIFKRAILCFIARTAAHPRRQIIHIGCGFDTISLLPYHHGHEKCHTYEVDFEEVVSGKAEIFRSDASIASLLQRRSGNAAASDSSSSSKGQEKQSTTGSKNDTVGPITFFGQDLRDVDALRGNLMDPQFGFDLNAPTLILSECVLVYMEQEYVHSLCSELHAMLRGEALWVTYDMINPDDMFGQKMRSNLESMGFNVPGLLEYPDLHAQQQRFLNAGWPESTAMNMQDYYTNCISAEQKAQLQRIEMLDEVEEFNILMAHYSLTIAYRSGGAAVTEGTEERAESASAPASSAPTSLQPLLNMFARDAVDPTATSTQESKLSNA